MVWNEVEVMKSNGKVCKGINGNGTKWKEVKINGT